MLWQCQARRGFDKGPHLPVADTLSVSPFNEKLQVDLPFLGDTIAPNATDMYHAYFLPERVRSTGLSEVWNASCGSWIAIFARPSITQIDEGE